MTILFSGWLADGATYAQALAAFRAHQYYNKANVPGTQFPVVEVPGNLDLLANPTEAGWCLRMQFTQDQIDLAGGLGVKTEMYPLSPTVYDDITDWGGASALVRRWYRFSYMVTSWKEEPRVVGIGSKPTSQLSVIWQLHDTADTTPADTYWEPPLWLIDDGAGSFVLRCAYDVNTLTGTNTVVRRDLVVFPRRLGVWEEIVIYMKPSWTNGELDVWHNNDLVFRERNVPNCYNHDPIRGGGGNFIEYGLYGGKAQQVTPHAVYHKGMHIGDQAYATYDAFMAACGAAGRQRRIFPITAYRS